MKINYFSDIHVEFGSQELAKRLASVKESDIIICAGDLNALDGIAQYLHRIDDVTNCPFLFVPGNHDYYGSSKTAIDQALADHQYKNVRVLNRGTFQYRDVLFIGATGWWKKVSSAARAVMNDFVMISDIGMAENGENWGMQDKAFFQQTLQQANSGKVVCISHHAPSYQYLPDTPVLRRYSESYANHWDEMIMTYQPDAWIHGHIHDASNDYMLGETRILSNPYGYKRRNGINPNWDERAFINL